MRRFSPILPTVLLLMVQGSSADDGCRGEVLKCYDCSSVNEPSCSDQFNHTETRIAIEPCRGWCVKIVEHIGTERERVLRTCTDKLHINPFIVGNMCMEESSGHGNLCFCRKDRCNGSVRGGPCFLLILLTVLPLVLSRLKQGAVL